MTFNALSKWHEPDITGLCSERLSKKFFKKSLLSGGSLPKFLAAGMKTDTGKSIDWSKVTFIFCDERLVPFDNPESTLGLYLNLFKDTDIKEDQFLKVAVDLDVESAAKDYEDKLKAVMGDQPKADILLLGKYLIIRRPVPSTNQALPSCF